MAFDAAADLPAAPGRVVSNPLAQTTGVAALGLKVQSLRRGIAAIQGSCQKIGTELDLVSLRRKMVGQIQKAVALTDEIEVGLRRATTSASGTRDAELQRSLAQLAAQFSADKSALVQAVRESQRLQHAYEPIDVHESDGADVRDAPRPAGNSSRPPRGGAEQRQQQEVVIELKNFGAVDAAIIEVRSLCRRHLAAQQAARDLRDTQMRVLLVLVQERNAEAQAIAQESLELHGMFKDLAILVSEQSKQLDEVEANVDAAHASVVAGNAELTTAAKYQNSYRKKICCVLFLVLLIIGIVLIPIVITQAPKWQL
jgi:hypothetical protein